MCERPKNARSDTVRPLHSDARFWWCPLPSFSRSRFFFQSHSLLRLLLFLFLFLLVHGSRLVSVGFDLVRAVDFGPFLFFISSLIFQSSSSSFLPFLLGLRRPLPPPEPPIPNPSSALSLYAPYQRLPSFVLGSCILCSTFYRPRGSQPAAFSGFPQCDPLSFFATIQSSDRVD